MTYMSTKRNSGTVAYQAPELLVDMDNPLMSKPDKVSTASDIYAFALVCYEVITTQSVLKH
jgi:serine/threonine protein kinase